MNVLQIIKHLRQKNNLSQKAIADKLGVSQSSYAKIELGFTELTFSKLTEIANILNISVTDIIVKAGVESGEYVSGEMPQNGKEYSREDVYKRLLQKNEELIQELREKANLYKQLYENCTG